MKVHETSEGADPWVATLVRPGSESERSVPLATRGVPVALGAGHRGLTASSVLGLQRLAGNASVVRLLQRSACGDTCRCGGRCSSPNDEVSDGVPIQTAPALVVHRQEATDDSCEQLISDEDWKIKGVKLKGGYDTGNFYKDVAKDIIAIAGQRGVDFHRALFIVAQARTEQGPTDPAPRRFRIMNVQVRDAEREGSQVDSGTGSKTVYVNPQGRKWTWLCSPEEGSACDGQPRVAAGCEDRLKDFPTMKPEACLRKSPFYVFDSMEESINNYLDEVTAERPTGKADEQGAPVRERPDAGKILLKEGQHERAGILEFGNALKRIGYASAKDYASAICDQYNTVTRDMTQILDQAIESKSRCLDDALKKVGPYWDKLNEAKKRYQQVKAEADARRAGPSRVSAVYTDEVAAAKEVKKWEMELADLEKLIPKLRKQLEELKRYRQQLQEVTCPTPTNKAAAAAALPS